jgi:hypothetical protein
MFRTVGYVFLVLLIGTFAIAWSQQGSQTVNRAETLAPDTMHLSAKALAVQEVDDMTFIYTNEK